MLTALAAVAVAGPTWETTLPTSRPNPDQPWRICLQLPADLGVDPMTVGDELTWATCDVTDGAQVCLTLTPDAPWPTRTTEIRCAAGRKDLTLRLIPAYDPHDDLADGKVVLGAKGVRWPVAGYAVDLPDQDGVMEHGVCAVRDGLLVIKLERPRRDAVCVLEQHGPVAVQLVRPGQVTSP